MVGSRGGGCQGDGGWVGWWGQGDDGGLELAGVGV